MTVHAQCNGDTALCNRPFDQVCFLYTHNSYNVRGPHKLPNHNLTVAQQLDRGVRGLMLDVYAHGDKVMLYHGKSILGHRPLQEDLQAIKAWLDAHPQEVMSIIFESNISAARLVAELTQAGLLPYLHAQPQGKPWPTLGGMIAAGKRLVIFSEKDRGNPYPWLHHAWDYITENHYSNHARSDFSTRYNRGDSTCSLYLLNNFITHSRFGFGLQDSAIVANDKDFIIDRALELMAAKGRFPNFVAVDFVEIGNAQAAVALLNRQGSPLLQTDHSHIRQAIWMNADRALFITLDAPQTDSLQFQVRSLATGEVVARIQSQRYAQASFTLQIQRDLLPGKYQLEAIGMAYLARFVFEAK